MEEKEAVALSDKVLAEYVQYYVAFLRRMDDSLKRGRPDTSWVEASVQRYLAFLTEWIRSPQGGRVGLRNGHEDDDVRFLHMCHMLHPQPYVEYCRTHFGGTILEMDDLEASLKWDPFSGVSRFPSHVLSSPRTPALDSRAHGIGLTHHTSLSLFCPPPLSPSLARASILYISSSSAFPPLPSPRVFSQAHGVVSPRLNSELQRS